MVLWQALDALSHQLELCAIDADRRVVVLVGPETGDQHRELVRLAVTRTGADAAEVCPLVPDGATRTESLTSSLIERADVIIIADPANAHVPLDDHQQLLTLAPVQPHHFRPNAALRRRVTSLVDRTAESSTVFIADAHGTDLTIDLTGSETSSDHGLIDKNHRIAVFPAGWVGVVPTRHTVNGQLVLMPGDANLDRGRHIESPVRLEIVDDYVSAIDGDSADADIIRAMFERSGDGDAYGFGGITVGMNPTIRPRVPFDDRLTDRDLGRLLAGVVTVSFGANLVADRPGDHSLTLALARSTVHLDHRSVVVTGTLDDDFAPDVYEL